MISKEKLIKTIKLNVFYTNVVNQWHTFPEPPDGYNMLELTQAYMAYCELVSVEGMSERDAIVHLQKRYSDKYRSLLSCGKWLRHPDAPELAFSMANRLPRTHRNEADRPDIIRMTGNGHWSLCKGVVEAKIARIQADARAWEQYGYYDLPTGSNAVKNGDPAQFIDMWLAIVEVLYRHPYTVKQAIDIVAEAREMKRSRVSNYWYASDKWLEAHRPLFYLQVKADLYDLERWHDYYVKLRGHLADIDYVEETDAQWKVKAYNKQVKKAYGDVNKKVKDRIGKSMIKYHNDGLTPRNPTMTEILRDKGLTIDEAYDFSAFDSPERAYHWRMYCDHTPLPDDVMKALL